MNTKKLQNQPATADKNQPASAKKNIMGKTNNSKNFARMQSEKNYIQQNQLSKDSQVIKNKILFRKTFTSEDNDFKNTLNLKQPQNNLNSNKQNIKNMFSNNYNDKNENFLPVIDEVEIKYRDDELDRMKTNTTNIIKDTGIIDPKFNSNQTAGAILDPKFDTNPNLASDLKYSFANAEANNQETKSAKNINNYINNNNNYNKNNNNYNNNNNNYNL